jgi:hypothetical protein
MELSTANGGSGRDYEPAPEGMHRAVCYRFVDLGTQTVEWKGQTKHQRKVLLSWELVDTEEEFVDGDGHTVRQPFSIHQRFTWSMHEKGNLRPFLESWRGRRFKDEDLASGGFDAQKLINAPCYMNVIHNEKDGRVYANIGSINPLPPQMKEGMPAMHNKPLYFGMTPVERFDKHALAALSDKMQETIKASPEYRAILDPKPQTQGDPADNALDDDIPF